MTIKDDRLPVQISPVGKRWWTTWYQQWLRFLEESEYVGRDRPEEWDRIALRALDAQHERVNAKLPEGAWFAAGSNAVFIREETTETFDVDALMDEAWKDKMTDWNTGWRP